MHMVQAPGTTQYNCTGVRDMLTCSVSLTFRSQIWSFFPIRTRLHWSGTVQCTRVCRHWSLLGCLTLSRLLYICIGSRIDLGTVDRRQSRQACHITRHKSDSTSTIDVLYTYRDIFVFAMFQRFSNSQSPRPPTVPVGYCSCTVLSFTPVQLYSHYIYCRN